MSFLEYRVKFAPTGLTKVLYVNWGLYLVITACAAIGWLMLYSISGGDMGQWAGPQMKRFGAGLVLSLMICLTPIWFWRSMSVAAYVATFALLLVVQFFGVIGMGAQRWIDIGFMRLQPSELMKVALVMMLATYYDWLPDRRVSRPLWVLVPVALILAPAALVYLEPNLGTTLMLVIAGAGVMFAAGVSLWYFAGVVGVFGAGVAGIFLLRGTPWQLIHDYQYRRIDTFLDPSADPLGAGYNILQAKIALGSGGWTGKGFMQGTQSRLNFLPEKHTDFIFTTLGEEFGFIGAISLLTLYAVILIFLFWAALQNKDRFSSLLLIGIAMNFFLYLAVNLAMVMGLAPVVGVPLPFLSYGGSATLVLLIAFGLAQSAIVHRLR
ncbi:rod shape-determining protein RodA [Rhodobacter sp. KR11]|uniref:rod shape-determining protein RodA n=1 Tax=Rhodobacter sp. KR11 TaxID=2974588 RepID=UPI002221AFFD|nr:rod shape-determining protein RodA [Rhodobacter sp. KR11]MCW1918635.1 rod shape-determining protein RodA [Rhodobacter sp. KR11]